MAAMLLMSLPLLAGKPWTKGGFETKKYRNLFVELGIHILLGVAHLNKQVYSLPGCF